MSIEEYSYAPDPMRDKMHVTGPFRLATGRDIIDSRGRVVARAVSGKTLDNHGNVRSWIAGRGDLAAVEADDHAHALANMLNRGIAPDSADTCESMLSLCHARMLSCPLQEREFWQRLSGSIRKARGMI